MSETIGRVGGEELDSDDVLLYRALSLLSSASLVTMLASLSVSKSPFILVATEKKKENVLINWPKEPFYFSLNGHYRSTVLI